MKSCHSVVTTMPTTACTTPCRHTSQSRSSWQSMWMVDSTTSPFCQLNDVGRAATCHSTLGDRAFPVAATQAWNTLPLDFRAAPSLATFQRRLKLSRFNASFPDDRNLISDLSILYSAPVTVLNCDSVTLIISLIIIIIKTTVVAW